ncbi:MAG: glycosyltransferase family 4 protein [Ornithinimicrobium sp.]
MRIGLVNPYSLDVPGGVQAHVIELSDYLIRTGHDVSVLTPAEPETSLPEYAVNAGRAVPVRYNGSVARLAFGPAVAARVNSWLEGGAFDVIHIHEPASPSTSLLALWAAHGPIVATFHSSQVKSRSLRLAAPMLQPGLDKISGRIAVSAQAQRTVREQLGGECVVIPNGVDVGRYTVAPPIDSGSARASSRWPTIVFLGRYDEPRKGLRVLLDALETIAGVHPSLRVLIAGPGNPREALRHTSSAARSHCEFLGSLSEEQKVAILREADLYVAPNTGGESFGIVLIEAMASGVPVAASNLPAFAAVLDDGNAGALFEAGDAADCARVVTSVLSDAALASRLRAAGPRRAGRYDWSSVGPQILAVYDSVRPSGSVVGRHRLPRRTPSTRRGLRARRGHGA